MVQAPLVVSFHMQMASEWGKEIKVTAEPSSLKKRVQSPFLLLQVDKKFTESEIPQIIQSYPQLQMIQFCCGSAAFRILLDLSNCPINSGLHLHLHCLELCVWGCGRMGGSLLLKGFLC